MKWIAGVTIILFVDAASAETLTLRNGTVVSGKLHGMDALEVGIERCGRVEQFAREEVKSISLETTGAGEPCSASSQAKLELPAGLSITVRTVDHIDSQHEPAGQVFRAVLETSIQVDGRILVSSGAGMIVKLTPAGNATSDNTLDLAGIQVGKRWAQLEPLPTKGVSLMSAPATIAVVNVSGVTSPDFRLDKILLRGARILAPSNTRLTFMLKQAVRLQL